MATAKPLLFLVVLNLYILAGEALALALTFSDFVAVNRTCDDKDSCKAIRGSRVGDNLDWRDRNCLCDDLCAMYGDCCVDAKKFNAIEQRQNINNFECVDLRQFGGIYMKTKCPKTWKDRSVRRRCENASDPSDPISDMPVTSHVSGYTYRNSHCAFCNGDLSSRVDLWRPRLECPSLLTTVNRYAQELTREKVRDALVFDKERGSWGLTVNQQGVRVFHLCHIDPVIPETSTFIVRRCQETVRACMANWTNVDDVKFKCESYTALVFNGMEAYRNVHCAVCNNIQVQNLACSKTQHRSSHTKDFSPVAFAVLFDILNVQGDVVGKLRPCPDGELFDPFFKKCRHVLCSAGQTYVDGQCLGDQDNPAAGTQTHRVTPRPFRTSTTPSPFLYITEDEIEDDYGVLATSEPGEYDNFAVLHTATEDSTTEETQSASTIEEEATTFKLCPKFLLDSEEFQIGENGSAYVATYKRTFLPNEYELNNGKLVICALGKEFVDKFTPYMGYVTFVGLGVSVVCLILHLVAFILVPDLQNLSGKNLASLCIAMLVAYLTFILAQMFKSPGAPCTVIAVLMYYSFLSAFFWMLTMAFDVWRTLKLATSELRVSAGKQWRKFVAYSGWSWLVPAVIVLTSVVIENLNHGTVPNEFRPNFGVHVCWFSQRKALLIFFAAPMALVMLLNVVFFACSAHMIFTTTSRGSRSTTSLAQHDFRLYIRLALIMGLTWIAGLVAGYLDMESLWYVFIAFNTLQGLFIFLAFTCTEKVIRSLRDRCGRRKARRPPSFSWSGASASTRKSNLGSRESSESHNSNSSHGTAIHNCRGGIDTLY